MKRYFLYEQMLHAKTNRMIMSKRFLLLLTLILSCAHWSIAQDDLYFTPSKKSAKKKVASDTSTEYDTWADNRTGITDVDTYNRRKSTGKRDSLALYTTEEEEGALTNRIVRFHAPGITVVSSPYYAEFIDIYTDPWYSFYRPYGWYDYHWYGHYGWHSSWWWNDPFYWHTGYYDPYWGWHHHYHPIYHPGFYPGWHPSHGGHHHHYYPSRTEHRRPSASNRGYRPSTERDARPSTTHRPRQDRGNVSTNRTTVSTDRGSRRPSSTTVAPTRTERPQRTMSGGGGGSRPQRSMGGGGGRRR